MARKAKAAKDVTIELAPDVKALADILIRPDGVEEAAYCQCAGSQVRLQSALIIFGFLGTHARKDGRAVLARTRKVNEQDKVLLGHLDQAQPAFVVLVAKDLWRDMGVAGRLALVDHELEHIGFNSRGGFGLRGHDLQEFRAVVARHGVEWEASLREFAEVCADRVAQLRLDLGPVVAVGGADVAGACSNGPLEVAA